MNPLEGGCGLKDSAGRGGGELWVKPSPDERAWGICGEEKGKTQ